MAAFEPLMDGRRRQPTASAGRILAYVGTYSSPQGSNRGQGIHILEMNPSSGALVPRQIVKSDVQPGMAGVQSRPHASLLGERGRDSSDRFRIGQRLRGRSCDRSADAAQQRQLGRCGTGPSEHSSSGEARAGRELRRRLGRGAADRAGRPARAPRLMSSATRARSDRRSRRALHPAALPSADTIDRTRT